MYKIAVVLPAFNEELTIQETIVEFHNELPDAYFLIVDNNSTDSTSSIASDTLHNIGAHGEVLHEIRQGKAMAVRSAFSKINAEIFVLADADLTYPASDVHKLLTPVMSGIADMSVGDRISSGAYKKENKRGFHNFGNTIVKNLINVLFKANLRDIMSGYRVLSQRFVKGYPILVTGFELETDLTVHALEKRFRIVEVPVEYRDRPQGSFSKLNTFADGFKVIKMIATIFRYYRPLAFFGVVAVSCGISCLAAGFIPIQDWAEMRFVEHVPLAILSVALGILSVLFFVCGLILDAIARQNRVSYELELLKMPGVKSV